ncbi:MAG: SpaA isopeptide-forming pilin-related protein [Christensenellales bacterium]|nr:SpaA isopeptide-forming pilin-related protein [Christensenellales bacterium]
MTKRIWAGLLALGMALTALPFGIYAEETAWEEEANASEETLDGGLDESAEEFADGLPDYIPEPETDVVDGAADDESADELSEQEESLIEEETTPDLPDFIPEEELPALEEEEPQDVQAGDFVRVTPNTRVYLEIDETAGDDDDGELYDGNFVNEANVYVEQARQDAQGRTWLLVRYLYGAEEPNGEMAWTDTATVWVLAEETRPSDAADYDVTDYAFPYPPAALYAASDFNLRDYNAGVQTFYPGQQNLYGSSGHDSEYKQIAKLDGYGTIYATPHYLEGQTVYCLEHTMNSPGTKNNASGPFEVVDLDGYAVKPGYSGDIYGSRTMHAIGWVLRHTYPYMIVDTGYEDSDVWSRVAGQFAIREVVKQLEGDWYVRDYWRMDEFYRASGQAPGDYLEYARWLAACAIERAGITGEIGISSKSVSMQNGSYVGTVTLTTDADLIRISRSVGNLTGNSAGSDGEYYYLRSGDTISVTSTQSTFSITAQSVSSQDEEAAFLIGIPNADIQKVIIPQYGMPAKLKEVRIEFEQPYGAVRVSKISADNGAVLSGATFELMNGAGTVLATQTTGVDGTARFDNLPAGGYTVREVGAPTGYKIAVNPSQAVTVAPGATSDIRFENDRVNGKIRIVKRDALTKEALAGAVFTVTRLSAAEGGGAVGEAVATLTTGADGTAETGWLQWGRYRVAETGVPEHYVDGGFVTEIDCTEDGKTYAVEAENEPTKGWIRLVKTDRLNGNPIEGVAFDIYENDEYGNALVAGMTTGKDGTAVSPPLRKGRYIVRERGATAGYVLEEIALDATVRSDETTQLRATNQPVMVKLKLYKRDGDEYGGDDPNSKRRDELPQPANIDEPSTRGDGELTGAVFRVLAGAEIRDRQGNVLFQKGDTVVDALTTAGDDASAATGELWPGLYEIIEVSPPVGYEPSDAHFFVDARSAASQSETAVVTYEGLKLNIIRQGVYAIVKFLGDNEIHDDAGLIETPEEGAEFELYLKKAGSYGNAREFERDYLVTNRYGYAKTTLLPYGLYVLKQVKGKEGHALKSPVEIFIRGDEDVANPPILTINNQAIRYRLKLIKTDAKTGKTVRLANTAFKLLDSDGNVVTQTVSYPTRREIDTFYTDENGEVTLPETVTRGMYFIEEVQAPQGYLIRTERLGVFVGETGDAHGEAYTLDIEIPNEPVMGRAMVEKKGLRLVRLAEQADAFGNIVHQPVYEEGYLAGAVFELRAAADVVGKDGTVWFHAGDVADTITTTEAGKDASKELPLGRYELVEVSAPEGCLLDSAPHEVELRYENDHTAVVETNVTLGNDYLSAEITLEKEKEDLEIIMEGDHVRQALVNTPGEGFVFGLFADEELRVGDVTLTADTLVATGATDAAGRLAFVGNFPHGAYYVKELSAPDGWTLNPAKFAVTLEPQAQSGGVIRVSLPEPVHNELIYTRVTLTKTDITGQKTLPGATIEVKDEQGKVIYRETTDANGQIPQIPVTPGTYTFKEVYAPDGYALNEAEMRFTVDADGNVTGDTTIRDDYTRFSLHKVDENGKPLAGVMFGLKKADGMLMMTAKTDAKGMATFEKVPFGTYTLVETQALLGYLKADTEIRLTVDGTFVNPAEPIAAIVNERQKIRGLKVDTAGQALPGAAFSLINADTGEIVDVAASDEKDEFYLTGFGYGDWIIRETVVPEGFNRVEDVRIHVDKDWKAPNTLLFTDIPNHYEFVKVDEDGCPMEGVKFALEDEDGNVLRELASGEDGIVRADDLKPGVYVIREIETQAGYHLTEETIRVVIDENYIVPDELFRLVNFPEEERPKDEIQTGVDVPVTPMMLYGLISMALGAVFMFAEIIHRRDQ